ncbi:hypothetical protein RFI_07325 [Reticulomyxa filosa]|uniref:Uncharacterized protein n=1 Tax=Reticulomyxa filosa TaxID=46433 RepID=X6NWX2_RETFI|nr:hypothetical protein RFI_07325 [Reticulomyxa filosa]|eukprot:ETO29792.1 hypothetical protein RFI_07325 [Reticulomyxa filosa]
MIEFQHFIESHDKRKCTTDTTPSDENEVQEAAEPTLAIKTSSQPIILKWQDMEQKWAEKENILTQLLKQAFLYFGKRNQRKYSIYKQIIKNYVSKFKKRNKNHITECNNFVFDLLNYCNHNSIEKKLDVNIIHKQMNFRDKCALVLNWLTKHEEEMMHVMTIQSDEIKNLENKNEITQNQYLKVKMENNKLKELVERYEYELTNKGVKLKDKMQLKKINRSPQHLILIILLKFLFEFITKLIQQSRQYHLGISFTDNVFMQIVLSYFKLSTLSEYNTISVRQLYFSCFGFFQFDITYVFYKLQINQVQKI